jgi:D-alanine-D-alanine ligase
MSKKVIVLCGGFSEEKEVSKKSSSAISGALIDNGFNVELVDPVDFSSYSDLINYIKHKNPYIVFNGLHGAEGEDGRIQSILSLEKIHFTGSKHTGSAIAMNKYVSTLIAKSIGVPSPKQVLLTQKRSLTDEEIEMIGLPLIVKPNSNGSSVGVHIVKEKQNLEKAVTDAYLYDTEVLCQQFIPGRELTVSVLGNEVLPVVEIIPNEGFYDYTNKYTKGKTSYVCPADLNDNEVLIIQKFAKDIFHTCSCSVYGRVDFRYDGNHFYFLEINTLPGMTELSLTPMAAKAVGLSFDSLIKRIIELSV